MPSVEVAIEKLPQTVTGIVRRLIVVLRPATEQGPAGLEVGVIENVCLDRELDRSTVRRCAQGGDSFGACRWRPFVEGSHQNECRYPWRLRPSTDDNAAAAPNRKFAWKDELFERICLRWAPTIQVRDPSRLLRYIEYHALASPIIVEGRERVDEQKTGIMAYSGPAKLPRRRLLLREFQRSVRLETYYRAKIIRARRDVSRSSNLRRKSSSWSDLG